MRISSKSHFIGQGRRIVTYVVFDKADHAASAERTIVYKDYVPPRIYMDKPLRYTISEAKNADLLKNMTVEDCLSGNLNSHIRMSLEDTWYDLDPGDYSLTVQVSNEAGDTCEIPMTATIVDNSLIESKKYYPILSDYVVYTTVNKPLALEDYTTGVMRGNTEYLFGGQETVVTPENIKITSAIDYSVPGVYEVKYSYTSLEGVTAVTTLYAVVEE